MRQLGLLTSPWSDKWVSSTYKILKTQVSSCLSLEKIHLANSSLCMVFFDESCGRHTICMHTNQGFLQGRILRAENCSKFKHLLILLASLFHADNLMLKPPLKLKKSSKCIFFKHGHSHLIRSSRTRDSSTCR